MARAGDAPENVGPLRPADRILGSGLPGPQSNRGWGSILRAITSNINDPYHLISVRRGRYAIDILITVAQHYVVSPFIVQSPKNLEVPSFYDYSTRTSTRESSGFDCYTAVMPHSRLLPPRAAPDEDSLPDETAPFLPRDPTTTTSKFHFLCKRCTAEYGDWLTELWFLTKAAVPVILAYMLQKKLQTVSVPVVGRLSSEALAVAAFSYMFAMVTAWLISLGGTSALNTLASSSFTSSKNKGNLGVLHQRGIVVLTGFYAVVAVIWAFSEHLSPALGQP